MERLTPDGVIVLRDELGLFISSKKGSDPMGWFMAGFLLQRCLYRTFNRVKCSKVIIYVEKKSGVMFWL